MFPLLDSLAVFVDTVLSILNRVHTSHRVLPGSLQLEEVAIGSLAKLVLLT
jgi:hypothetical protein